MIDSQNAKGSNEDIARQTVVPARMARFRFDAFVLDVECARLLGPEGDIRLRAKAFRVLTELLEAAPHIVSTERLLDRVWGTRHLTRNAVAQTIQEVRQALKGGTTELIENVPKVGYRVIVPVERLKPAREEPPPAGAEPQSQPEAAAPEPVPQAPSRDTALRPGYLALGLVLLALVVAGYSLLLSGSDGGFTSAADTGVRIEGRGAAAIETALRRGISHEVERRWQIRPVDLSGVAEGAVSAVEGGDLARRFHVDTWYGGALTLGEAGGQSVVDGELVIGSRRGSTTLSVPVRALPLAELPTLAARVASLLGEVASWDPPEDAETRAPLADGDSARITEADVAIARGRPDSALLLLNEVSQSAARHPDYLKSRARALLLQGRRQAVLDLLPAEPDDEDLRLLWAHARGDRAGAVAIAERRYAANPASARHGLEYVEAILHGGDHVRALLEIARMERRPMSEFDRDEFALLRASLLNSQGAHQEAERILAGLVQPLQELGTSELLLRARREQALAVSMLGRWDEALAAYTDVAEQSAGLGLARLEASALFHIADIRKAQQDTTGAAALLRDAIARFSEPDFADLLPELQLGLAYIAMDSGDVAEAEHMAEATGELSLQLESNTLPPKVAALRSEIALMRLELPVSIELMEESVSATCANAEYGDAARLLFRLSSRYLLASALPAAQQATQAARRACAAVGDPGYCRIHAESLDAILNEGSRDAAVLQRIAEQKRALREYAAATLALLRSGAADAARAAITLGDQQSAGSPAHYRALWALVEHLVALESAAPMPGFPADLSARFPEVVQAADVMLALARARRGDPAPLASVCGDAGTHALCNWARPLADPARPVSSPWPLLRPAGFRCEPPLQAVDAQPGSA